MIRILVLATFAVVAFGSVLPRPDDFFGSIQDLKNNVGTFAGEIAASPGQFPHQASIRSSGNAHFCGGSIANDRWIVTAAHCVFGRNNLENTIVVLGTHSRTNGGTRYSLIQIISHPDYNPNTIANDVALLQTSSSIVFNDLIQPIALGSEFIGGGVVAVAPGWGRTEADLQYVFLKTLTNDDCRDNMGGMEHLIFDHKICASAIYGQEDCSGNSGGSMAVGNTAIGILSWGIPCGRGFPNIFDRISYHRAWIVGHF